MMVCDEDFEFSLDVDALARNKNRKAVELLCKWFSLS